MIFSSSFIMTRRGLTQSLCGFAIGFLAAVSAAPLPAELPPEAAERMLNELKYLASDELEGRGVGTRGLDLAAEAVREGFAEAGLDVTAVNGGAFQEFEIVAGSELKSPNELAFLGPDGERTELEYDAQFRTCSFGAAGEFSAPLVFCGYGIVDEDVGYDDFAGIDVTGKVAVILRRTPQQGEEEGLFGGPHSGTSRHAALNTKLNNAVSRGAAAVVFVNDAYSGQFELEQLKAQRDAAEQRVIDAAITVVEGNGPAASVHGHHGNPHSNPHAQHGSTKENDTIERQVEQSSTRESSPDKESAHANPHASASTHPPHGHGEPPADDTLQAAVTHLQEVRKLIDEYEPDPLIEFGYNGNRRGDSIPVLHVARSAIDGPIRAATGQSLDELEAAIDERGRPHSMALDGWKANGETSLVINHVTIKNVIGVLPGEGPLADETIVVGAHYDHLGRGGEGSLMPGSNDVHNGADDNASGTVALIELARRLAARPEPLPRQVVFLAFTGEERGLLGSAHYVKAPVFPLENTIAMFNMDMVGRLTDDKLVVFGTGTATRWDDFLGAAEEEYNFDLSKKPEGFGPSDHSSFYAKEIPVLHFFTGTHNDYHRPTDDWPTINIDGIGRVVALLEDLVVTTAATDQRPEYVAVKGKAELPARTGSRPYFGSIPDFGGEVKGYSIQGASPGSPADRAGLKGGDVIIKLGKFPVTGLDDFDLVLREFSAGEEVTVVVLRDGNEQEFRVTLATPR